MQALRGIGPTADWATAALRRAAALHGASRAAALRSLAAALRRSLGGGAASVDPHRLAQLAAANQATYMGFWQRATRFALTWVAGVLGKVLSWLGAGNHYIYVAGLVSLCVLLWVGLRYGRLVPRGAANALYGEGAASPGPAGLWRQAQERWNRGDRRGALAFGRSAVIARLDQSGLLRAVPGISDRELERKLERSDLAPAARTFRRAHALGRWADGRDEALQEAWEQLGLLWRGGASQ